MFPFQTRFRTAGGPLGLGNPNVPIGNAPQGSDPRAYGPTPQFAPGSMHGSQFPIDPAAQAHVDYLAGYAAGYAAAAGGRALLPQGRSVAWYNGFHAGFHARHPAQQPWPPQVIS